MSGILYDGEKYVVEHEYMASDDHLGVRQSGHQGAVVWATETAWLTWFLHLQQQV